jgi:hypothetical protein
MASNITFCTCSYCNPSNSWYPFYYSALLILVVAIVISLLVGALLLWACFSFEENSKKKVPINNSQYRILASLNSFLCMPSRKNFVNLDSLLLNLEETLEKETLVSKWLFQFRQKMANYLRFNSRSNDCYNNILYALTNQLNSPRADEISKELLARCDAIFQAGSGFVKASNFFSLIAALGQKN